MKQKSLFFIASLSILVPATARLGYGIVLLLGFVLINIFSAFLFMLLKKLNIENFELPLKIFSIIAITIIFKECVRYYSPIISFNVHFSLYLLTFNSFLFLMQSEDKGSVSIVYLLKQSFKFFVFGLVFFMIREYAAYASISFPLTEGLYILRLPSVHLFNSSFLWSSTAFALTLLAITLIIIISFFQKKNNIAKRIIE